MHGHVNVKFEYTGDNNIRKIVKVIHVASLYCVLKPLMVCG